MFENYLINFFKLENFGFLNKIHKNLSRQVNCNLIVCFQHYDYLYQSICIFLLSYKCHFVLFNRIYSYFDLMTNNDLYYH